MAILILSGCIGNGQRRENRLMDEIESKLDLPKGALPLAAYARYYTEDDGAIIGAFTTEVEEVREGTECLEMQLDSSTKGVPCPAIADLTPGHRRWVPQSDLPAVSNVDCQAVQIMYNPASRLVEYAECATPDY